MNVLFSTHGLILKVYFCTACDLGLVFGRRRCRACGEPVGGGKPLQRREPTWWSSRSAWLSAFFGSQASLSLATLMVFLGLGIALVPAGWSYALMQLNPPATPSAQTSAKTSANCRGLLVFFSEMATVGEVSALVRQLNAAVVSGPSPAGAFELAVPENALDAVAESLGKAENTVNSVFVKSRCGRS